MSERTFLVTEVLSRAFALSSLCGAEGQINLHKLLEAAVYSVLRGAAASNAGVSMLSFSRVVQDLRALGLDSELAKALELGAEVVQVGGVPLVGVTPDAFVCRTCGHTALASAPERCPVCGAWSVSFRRFMGIFNVDNPDPLSSLAILAQGPDEVEALIADLPEESTMLAPALDEWSIQRALQHLVDAQDLFAGRLHLMLTQKSPPLAVEFTWAKAREAQSTRALLADFRRKREATVAMLEELPMKQWGRTGCHDEFGVVTVLHQAGYFAYHEAFYYPDFVVKRRQIGMSEP